MHEKLITSEASELLSYIKSYKLKVKWLKLVSFSAITVVGYIGYAI